MGSIRMFNERPVDSSRFNRVVTEVGIHVPDEDMGE